MSTLPDADLSPPPSRYYAADYAKLTNRRPSSPLTPDFAWPDRVIPARAALNRPTASTSDRRASPNNAPPCVLAQGAPSTFARLRQGSGSSVKEEVNGISELTGLDWEPSEPAIVVKAPKVWGPGEAPLERLPVEVLGKLTKRPVNPNGLRLICVKTKLSPNWQLIRNPRDIHHATWT
ncbi:MAG: hypothetical protein Q9203_006928 [Teloschistes exilis]